MQQNQIFPTNTTTCDDIYYILSINHYTMENKKQNTAINMKYMIQTQKC